MSRRWAFNAGGGAPLDEVYAAAVLADSPAIYYKLDETSGVAAVDSSGNGRHGTYAGGPSLNQAGPFVDSVSVAFDGTDDRLTPDVAYSPSITDFTFECWFKVAAAYSTGLSTFISWQENGGTNGGPAVGIGGAPGGIGATGAVWCGWTDSGISEIGRTTTATFNDGNWHHLVAVVDGTAAAEFDGSHVTIYIDNVANPGGLAEETFANQGGTYPYAVNRAFFAGTAAAGWDNFTACSLSHLAVYETALSSIRVAAHYAASGL